MNLLKYSIVLFSLWSNLSYAQSRTPRSEPQYEQYYTIAEDNLEAKKEQKKSIAFEALPLSLSLEGALKAARLVILNLLKWTLHSELRPLPQEQYIRKLHFGRWINDPMDNTCMNTRARVLVRDSEDQVTFRGHKNCVVDTGQWLDPYSGRTLTNAREIQIDHMVPLKSAYLAGAHAWDYKTRCLYANYEGYRNHLVPSTVRENTSKGDRGPEKYLPSDETYRCQYVKDWLSIKLIWKLNLTPDEIEGIAKVVESYNCNTDDFMMSEQELQTQRQYINDNIEFCMSRRR